MTFCICLTYYYHYIMRQVFYIEYYVRISLKCFQIWSSW